MKKYFKRILKQLKWFWSKPILIFVHHQISEQFVPGVDCETDWNSIDLYRKNIEWLIRNYEVISLEEAINLVDSGKRIKKKYAVLTFDDGYASVSNALVVLEEYQLPATLFINTAYLGDCAYSPVNIYNYVMAQHEPEKYFSKDLVSACKHLQQVSSSAEYKGVLESLYKDISQIIPSQKVYFTLNEIKNLNPDLFTIALHGHEHLISHFLTDAEFMENIKTNVTILSEFPNFKPYFAFPFGSTDSVKTELVLKKELKPVLCNGQNYKRGDKYVNRIPVDGIKLWETFR